MRRFLTIPAAGVLALALAAPAMAGANVGNFSGSVTMAQGGWDSFDDETLTYTSGYIAVSRDAAGGTTYAEYGSYTETKLQCTGADTPNDPDDDTYAGGYSNDYGYAEGVTLTIGKRNASAHAAGSMDAYHEEYNECTGESTFDELGSFEFSLDLTATSSPIRESGRGSFHVPGEFSGHSTYRSAYRLAGGTFDGADGSHAVDGQIGSFTWRDHSNG
jgi:hypothetical protein